MSEQQPNINLCRNCPDRSRMSRAILSFLQKSLPSEGCEGRVKVNHGKIITQIRTGDEPAPAKGTWTRLTIKPKSDNERCYSRTEWESETVCGREAIEPREDEEPYDGDGAIHTGVNGQRMAAFVAGTESELSELKTIQTISYMLDEPVATEDSEAIDKVVDPT